MFSGKGPAKNLNFLLTSSTGAENSSENNKEYHFEDLLLESSSDEEYAKLQKSKEMPIIPKFQATTNTDTDSSARNVVLSKINAFLSEPISDDEEAEIEAIVEAKAKNVQTATEEKSTDGKVDNDELTVLAMIWQNGHLGAACYNLSTCQILVMDDVPETEPDFGRTRALYRQCQPSHAVVLRAGGDAHRNVVKRLVLGEFVVVDDNDGANSDATARRAAYFEVPGKEANFDACRHRVECLRLETDPAHLGAEERRLRLRGVLDFKSRAMTHALGLLLKFLDQHWNGIALQAAGSATFLAIRHVVLEDIVMISEDVYKNLSIMQTRQHPSFCKFGNPNAKMEGISLFHLLNRCLSVPGVKSLRGMLRTPTRNVNVLNRRFDVIEFLMEPNNQNVLENLTPSLRDIHRLTKSVLSRFTAPQAKVTEWKKLHKTLSSVVRIADVCDMLRAKPELFREIGESVTDDMRHIKYFVEYIVDFEASKRMNAISVKVGVDPKLDELFYVNNHMPTLLTDYAEKETPNLCERIKKWQVIFLPNVGFLLGVHEWNGSPPERAQQDFADFEYKFSISEVPYYKNPAIKQLDDKYGNITLNISKREAQIILRLSRYVSNHAGSILRAVELCAELDALRSFSEAAQDGNYVRPNVVESQIIDVKRGKHPLLAFMHDVVPNDVYSARDGSLAKIVTGPNACGKSVYLKQVALIVFMAHVGSYVPAESATIGVLTHILMQRPLVDSISLNSSTFLQDLRQINAAIYQSTPNSLVIIDEFGLGTDETSGTALLTAVLSDFIERGEYCPHIFAATHIHRVLTLLPPSSLFEAQTFDYMVNDDHSIVFLYRLRASNEIGCSFAHAAARAAGLDESVVSRALEVYERVIRGESITVTPELQRINAAVDRVWELVILNDPSERDLEEVEVLVQEVFGTKE